MLEIWAEKINEHGWMRVCMVQLATTTTVGGGARVRQARWAVRSPTSYFSSLSLCFFCWVWR